MGTPKNHKTIWFDSPCTLSYTSQLPPLEKSKRFHINSIYYRDQMNKPIKKDEQLRKPDLILNDFRRSLKEVDNSLKRNLLISKKSIKQKRTHNLTIQPHNKKMQFSSRESQVISRLCPQNAKIRKLEYDLYGNRSSFYASGTQLDKMKKKFHRGSPQDKNRTKEKKSEGYFSEGVRIDMSRPQNFNPGPGSYFIQNLFRTAKASGQSKHSIIFDDSKSKQTAKTLDDIQMPQSPKKYSVFSKKQQ